MNDPSLLDVLRIAKENVRLASESYARAAQRINSLARQLFGQLSEFEQFHYDQLTALEKSLQEKRNFINDQCDGLILPPALAVQLTDIPEHQSLLDIIYAAIQAEKQAENAYARLASQIPQPPGHTMFIKLSREERKHFNILGEAFWSLNQTGRWNWSRDEMKDQVWR